MPPFLLLLVPAAVAVLAAATVRLLARWRPALLPAALPVGLLAGAVALTLPFNLRAVWAPRVLADHLLLAALGGLAATASLPRLRRRWVPALALAMCTGWWVARTPPAMPEFWRAGLIVTIYALLLMRSRPPALLAGAVAGIFALMAAGAAPVWQLATSVAAAACAGVIGTAVPSLAAASFIAAAASLASLAGGRAVSGRFTLMDAAALAPLLAALCWPLLARRLPAAPFRIRRQATVAVRRRRA